MTKLEKLELEVAKLRAEVAELKLATSQNQPTKSVRDLFGIYANDPVMQAMLIEDEQRRQRERDRELANFDRRQSKSRRPKASAVKTRAKVA